MNYSLQRTNLINEQAVTSDDFADFFRCVRGDQTLIICERVFFNNNHPRLEYLLYCNPLKYAIWVSTSNLNCEQAAYMQNELIKDWHKRNGTSRGPYYPQVEFGATALQLLIMNSQYDRAVDNFAERIDRILQKEPEDMWD